MLTNGQLSELLAAASETHERGSNKEKALRRASRATLFWPEEAGALVEQDRSLTELPSVGPWLAKVILEWLAPEGGGEAPELLDGGGDYGPRAIGLAG